MTSWDDYLELLGEAAGLDDERARKIAEADAVFTSASRRIEAQRVDIQHQVATLVDRNTRLQLGIRDLVSAAGARIPQPNAEQPPIPFERLSETMKSAEYDLEQWRISLDRLMAQKLAIQSAPVAPDPPHPTAAAAPPPTPAKERQTKKRVPLLAAATVVLAFVVVAVVAVVVLR